MKTILALFSVLSLSAQAFANDPQLGLIVRPFTTTVQVNDMNVDSAGLLEPTCSWVRKEGRGMGWAEYGMGPSKNPVTLRKLSEGKYEVSSATSIQIRISDEDWAPRKDIMSLSGCDVRLSLTGTRISTGKKFDYFVQYEMGTSGDRTDELSAKIANKPIYLNKENYMVFESGRSFENDVDAIKAEHELIGSRLSRLKCQDRWRRPVIVMIDGVFARMGKTSFSRQYRFNEERREIGYYVAADGSELLAIKKDLLKRKKKFRLYLIQNKEAQELSCRR